MLEIEQYSTQKWSHDTRVLSEMAQEKHEVVLMGQKCNFYTSIFIVKSNMRYFLT